MKNIEYNTVMKLTDQIVYGDGQVVSKTFAQNSSHSLTIFSFDEGEEISTHKSEGDALIQILEGKAKVIIEDKEYFLSKGESIVMPAKKPHAVCAVTKFKMLLTVFFR